MLLRYVLVRICRLMRTARVRKRCIDASGMVEGGYAQIC